MSRQRPKGLFGGVDDHQVFISVFRLPEAQPGLHPVSAVLRLVVSTGIGIGEGNTGRDHDHLLASFSSSVSPLRELPVFLMVQYRHVFEGLDFTNEIIDFWLLLWLLTHESLKL